MPVISFENVTKVYPLPAGDVVALDGVDIAIEEGEFVLIMGPSGSGKSTLLNIMGSLDVPTSGEVTIAGRKISRMDDDDLTLLRRDHIGFVFQQFNLLPRSTALENVALPLVYRGVSRGEGEARALAMLEKVGMKDRAWHRPAELSGGQQQRVAVARALANDPLVILADEPTGNLDSRTGEEIMDLILGLHRQGKTIILVTHDAKVATHAQRIIRLADGIIIADERREEGPDVVA